MGPTTVRILVVEDHADTLAMLQRLLRHQGYHVLTADSVNRAMRVGQMHEFEVLLTDLQLPDGWGWTLGERLRHLGRRFTAIALSGHGSRYEDAVESAGFCANLTKPIDFKTLVDTLELCVAGIAQPGHRAG